MIRSHIIHMTRSTARDGLVAALREALPEAEVVEAVDGRSLPASERAAAHAPRRYAPPYPFDMLPSEIGCFLSHRRAWRRIVQSGAEAGFVAEDDVAVDAAPFADARALALAHVAPNRLIRFPLKPRERAAEVLDRSGAVQLVRPEVVGLSAALYLLGREAAERLLELTEPFDRPVDTFLQMGWLTGVETLSVHPNGARSAAGDFGGSTVQSKRSATGELSRAWRRGLYRIRVRHLSRRAP